MELVLKRGCQSQPAGMAQRENYGFFSTEDEDGWIAIKEKLANRKLDTICAHFLVKHPKTHGELADAHALRQVRMRTRAPISRHGGPTRTRTWNQRIMSPLL